MTRRVLSLSAVSLLLTFAVAAQQFPTLERGFSSGKMYSFGDIDAINSFNGNLSLQIPLGLSYPVNGSFSYGLRLHYNSKVWDYEDRFSAGKEYALAVPNRDSNAGMGWLLDFGRLASPSDSANNLPDEFWNYLSDDGARHTVGGPLHPGSASTSLSGNVTAAGYSSDGSYLRMLTKSDSTTEVDTPDGIARTFVTSTGDFLQMSDPYGNSVSVRKYAGIAGTPCPFGDSSAWEIDDSQARTHWVCFENTAYPESAYAGQMVERVILAAPGSATATYQFTYTPMSIQRGGDSTYPFAANPIPNVPMLTGLTLPDGTAYAFTYNTTRNPNTGVDHQGAVSSVTLPTQAMISYAYRLYQMPGIGACDSFQQSKLFFSNVVGIGTKTISGANLTPATWQWNSTINNPLEYVQCIVVVGGAEFTRYFRAPADQAIVTVTNPDQNVTEYYYSTWPGAESLFQQNGDGSYSLVSAGYPVPSEHGAIINEYGLPFTRLASSNGRFLSSRQYTATGYTAGTPLRSQYGRYEYDDQTSCFSLFLAMKPQCLAINPRMTSSETVFHDDANRTADADSLDFDGFGNYRKAITNGTFNSGDIRTSYTAFNPGTDPNGNLGGAFAFASNTPWILSKFGDQWFNENGHTSKMENCFDTKGFLKARRVLLGDAADVTGIAQSSNDLLVLFSGDAQGNVTKEQYFGGDQCGAPTTACASAPSCVPVNVSICSASASVPSYDVHHGFLHGSLATSQYFQCNDVTPASFKSVDRDIDSVGVVSAERDSAGVQTDYGYDAAGRVTSVRPSGEAEFAYTYAGASTSYLGAFTPAIVHASRSGAAAEYQYDAMGRVWREKQLMPDGTWSLRETLYDSSGRKTSVSDFETMPAGADDYTFHPSRASHVSYDPFSRPLAVTALDGSATSYVYTGLSTVKQTVNRLTASGPTPVLTLKTFDRQGRLWKLTEAYQSASEQTTTYSHDVGGRLSFVSMTNASGTQTRSFSYDGRGFLTGESHPENGTLTYRNYDAKGHVGQKLLGNGATQFDLQFTYDNAERLVLVEGRSPYNPMQFRTLKQFVFGTANNGTDRVNGKLQSALRQNYDAALGQVNVTETFHYQDSAGHLTSKDTAITGVNSSVPNQTLTQGYSYNDFGQQTIVTYPTCTSTTIRCGQAAWASVNSTYAHGWLTGMGAPGTANPSLADSISYAANGNVSSIVHSNGVTDTMAPDPTGLPRPKSITVSGWSACSPPIINGQPANASTFAGGMGVPLTVSASGTGTLHYLWHGPAGSIANDSPTLNTGPLTQTSTYYVVVTDDCGTAQSQYATVTVCSGVAIITEPLSTSVGYNQSTTLSVVALSSPFLNLQFTWYQGTAPDTSHPVWAATLQTDSQGHATSFFATPNLTATTNYWVRVTDPCGAEVNSNTVTVTVSSPPPGAPSGLVASYNGFNANLISWFPASGATHYLLERCANFCGGASPAFAQIQDVASTSAVDGNIAQGAAYVYRVRAANGSGTSSYSNYELETASAFVAQGGAPIRYNDVQQLLSALNAMRAAAGLSAVGWADILPFGVGAPSTNVIVAAIHLTSLRSAMDSVRQTLNLASLPSPPISSGAAIRAADLQNVQLRAQ